MTSCVLLAAGQGRRFGSSKALAELDGQTVIERLQETLLNTDLAEIIIVLGAHADLVRPFLLKHTNIKVVYNKDHKFGQTSSFKAGLRELSSGVKGVMLLPVDYPLVRPATIDQSIAYFREKSPLIVVPTFNDEKGHPPLFSSRLSPEFFDLKDEVGVNTVIHDHAAETKLLPVQDEGVILTFDTKEEFERLKPKANN